MMGKNVFFYKCSNLTIFHNISETNKKCTICRIYRHAHMTHPSFRNSIFPPILCIFTSLIYYFVYMLQIACACCRWRFQTRCAGTSSGHLVCDVCQGQETSDVDSDSSTSLSSQSHCSSVTPPCVDNFI